MESCAVKVDIIVTLKTSSACKTLVNLFLLSLVYVSVCYIVCVCDTDSEQTVDVLVHYVY